jgi:hypothetical protein
MNDNDASFAVSLIAVLIVTCCFGFWLAFRDREERKDTVGDRADAPDALDLVDQVIDFDD